MKTLKYEYTKTHQVSHLWEQWTLQFGADFELRTIIQQNHTMVNVSGWGAAQKMVTGD